MPLLWSVGETHNFSFMEAQALPKITLVTPVLNGGGNLRSTLESIVQQQYPNLEYIVVDVGSTDN